MAKKERSIKSLPKQVFAYWDGEPGDEYVITHVDPSETVEPGETRIVGVYKLSGFAEVSNYTKVTINHT